MALLWDAPFVGIKVWLAVGDFATTDDLRAFAWIQAVGGVVRVGSLLLQLSNA